MVRLRKKSLSLLLIFSLLVGIVGIINVDTTYAASKKIHLEKTKVTLVAGKTFQQQLIDKNGKTIKASKVKWKSLKKSVAKISKKGIITAVKAGTAKMTAKYKGKTYKFTVKVKKAADPKEYTNSDFFNVLDYTGYAQDWADNISIDAKNFQIDGFSRSSSEIREMKKDTYEARVWLEEAKAITGSKYTRNCTRSEAIEEGYKTWDGMLDSIIEECLYIENVDISSLKDIEVASIGLKALNVARHINIAYIEFYYRGE